MASLSGQNPSATFGSLIKTINNLAVSGSLVQLSDGNGNALPISVSTANVSISSPLTASIVSATSNGLGTNFKVGDDVFIGDVNLSNTMQVAGQQSAAQGYIKFGSGSTNPILGANNSNVLAVSANGIFTVGSYASTTTYPTASVIVSNVPFTSDIENHVIGVVGAGIASATGDATSGWGVGGYFKGWTKGGIRSAGVIGEGMVSASADGGSAIGVRAYSDQVHAGGANIALYGEAISGSTNYALYMNKGDIYSNVAQAWTLQSNTNALNIQSGLLNINTLDSQVSTTGNFTASIVSATSNGLGTNFKVGDDVFIGDVNLSNTMQVKGQQDAAQAFIKFASGSQNFTVGADSNKSFAGIGLNMTGSVSIATTGSTWHFAKDVYNSTYLLLPNSSSIANDIYLLDAGGVALVDSSRGQLMYVDNSQAKITVNFPNANYPEWIFTKSGSLSLPKQGIIYNQQNSAKQLVFDTGSNVRVPVNLYVSSSVITNSIYGSGGFVNVSGSLLISSGSTNQSSVIINDYNQRGGAGYTGFLQVTNTLAGALTPSKFFRLDSSGSIQIINSAYSSTLLTLTDSGNLVTSGSIAAGSVLSLVPQNPLPAASTVPYSFAVSASTPTKPYFSDGTNWNALY